MTEQNEDSNDRAMNATQVLNHALMVYWDDLEQALEGAQSPLVSRMLETLRECQEALRTLSSNDMSSKSGQFGTELSCIDHVAEEVMNLMREDEFSIAQWGVAYSHIQNTSNIPAAIIDAFDISFSAKDGFEIDGLKPMSFDGEHLSVEMWGAAHQLAEIGLLDQSVLDDLPRPRKEIMFDDKMLDALDSFVKSAKSESDDEEE